MAMTIMILMQWKQLLLGDVMRFVFRLEVLVKTIFRLILG